MQGKDAYNPDGGYPPLPEQDSTPRTAPPPYTDEPQPGYPHPPQDAGYPKPPVNTGYPHPQDPAVQPTAPATTVIAGPTIIVQTVVGPESTRTTCRSCNHQISTRIDRRSTMKTHLMALLLCILGCSETEMMKGKTCWIMEEKGYTKTKCWCCVCVPYLVDSCLDVDHYCPNCGAFVGSYAT